MVFVVLCCGTKRNEIIPKRMGRTNGLEESEELTLFGVFPNGTARDAPQQEISLKFLF